MTDKEKILLNLLLEEKKLVHSEKLQLLKTVKSIIGFLFPFITLLVAAAKETEILFLLIPIVISSIAFFLLVNENALNLIYEYLTVLDKEIINLTKNNTPYFQITVGELMSTFKFNLNKKSWSIIPEGYHLLAVALVFFIVPIYLYSIFMGNSYLIKKEYYYWNYLFNSVSILFFILVIYSIIIYTAKFNEMRKVMIAKKVKEIKNGASNNDGD